MNVHCGQRVSSIFKHRKLVPFRKIILCNKDGAGRLHSPPTSLHMSNMIAAPNGRVNLTSRLASPRILTSLSCRLKAECRTTALLVLSVLGYLPPPRLTRQVIPQFPIRPSIDIPISDLAAATLLTPPLSRPHSSTISSNIVSTPMVPITHRFHYPRKYYLVLENMTIKVTASGAQNLTSKDPSLCAMTWQLTWLCQLHLQ